MRIVELRLPETAWLALKSELGTDKTHFSDPEFMQRYGRVNFVIITGDVEIVVIKGGETEGVRKEHCLSCNALTATISLTVQPFVTYCAGCYRMNTPIAQRIIDGTMPDSRNKL